MHNNYFFLRQLSGEIEKNIKGFTLVSIFSQSKDELITEFNNGKKSFFIKASLLPALQCLTFPQKFNRANKNSVDLFSELLMKKVVSVRQFANERSFAVTLEGELSLVFKMHGSMANVIGFKGNEAFRSFRKNLTSDLELKLNELDRRINWSFENFISNISKLDEIYFTFGKPVWTYLNEHHFKSLETEKQFELLKDVLVLLHEPNFHLIDSGNAISLSLLPYGMVLEKFGNPVEAVNEFFIRNTSSSAFRKEKTSQLSDIRGKIKQGQAYLKKTEQKLAELDSGTTYQQWADLIMANLHQIKKGQEKFETLDFYDGKPVSIKLKKDLNAQQNAEAYYRKARNQGQEVKILEESIAQKKQEINGWFKQEKEIQEAETSGELKTKASPQSKKKAAPTPYHEFEFKGFKILVGKNAKVNDELTLKYSFKEDLWLHAKDVPGSHVLVKYQSGKNFPKDVIERAAQLAAFYSKRKNEKLCPVAITTKKYVRKRKGDPPGMVVVDREKVMMVEPVSGNQ